MEQLVGDTELSPTESFVREQRVQVSLTQVSRTGVGVGGGAHLLCKRERER